MRNPPPWCPPSKGPFDPRRGRLRAAARTVSQVVELNATELVHGSYGIEERDVVLTDALDLETLDFEEFRSSYESLIFAASSHLPGLAELILVAHEG